MTTVNNFLKSIKYGNPSDFVHYIENMTPEQVESLTDAVTKELFVWYSETDPNRLEYSFSLLNQDSRIFSNLIEWAFENLRYDYNSCENQSIKSRLVERHVYACQSSLVSHLYSTNPDEFETEETPVFNVDLSTGQEELTEDEKDERLEELQDKLKELEESEPVEPDDDESREYEYWEEEHQIWEDEKEAIERDISALEDAEPEYPEVYEYWVVSSWLESKLKENGGTIVEHTPTGETWWGRGTTGQAILLDHIISQIAFDMEILEFQPNS